MNKLVGFEAFFLSRQLANSMRDLGGFNIRLKFADCQAVFLDSFRLSHARGIEVRRSFT